MVEIVRRTEKEKQAIGRMKMLEEIAKEMFRKKEIINLAGTIYVSNSETKAAEISVIHGEKEVAIQDPRHYDAAYQLALAYETYDGEEWTLKTNYNE